MDWTQTLAVIGSTTAIIATLIGSVFVFYRLTRDEIAVIREDMRLMDTKIDRMEAKWDSALQRMDAKWERLFERLLLQDQQRGK